MLKCLMPELGTFLAWWPPRKPGIRVISGRDGPEFNEFGHILGLDWALPGPVPPNPWIPGTFLTQRPQFRDVFWAPRPQIQGNRALFWPRLGIFGPGYPRPLESGHFLDSAAPNYCDFGTFLTSRPQIRPSRGGVLWFVWVHSA